MLLIPEYVPDSKVHVANMGPTWVLSAPAGPHVGPMDLAIRAFTCQCHDGNPIFIETNLPKFIDKTDLQPNTQQ